MAGSVMEGETLLKTLAIEIVEAGKERVVARMPVTPRLHQPFGLLHGGASVALAETAASAGAWMNVDQARGRRTQVWQVQITDESGKPVCVSRCTLAVVAADAG